MMIYKVSANTNVYANNPIHSKYSSYSEQIISTINLKQ